MTASSDCGSWGGEERRESWVYHLPAASPGEERSGEGRRGGEKRGSWFTARPCSTVWSFQIHFWKLQKYPRWKQTRCLRDEPLIAESFTPIQTVLSECVCLERVQVALPDREPASCRDPDTGWRQTALRIDLQRRGMRWCTRWYGLPIKPDTEGWRWRVWLSQRELSDHRVPYLNLKRHSTHLH